jgi:flagellar motor switch protein FliN/FliY
MADENELADGDDESAAAQTMGDSLDTFEEESLGTETADLPATMDAGGELLAQADDSPPPPAATDLDAVYDVPVQLSAVLGRASMQVAQLLKLGRGAVVELDRKVGEAIDIYINNRLVARGEVVVVEDKLGVTMTEIIKSDRAN